MHYLSIIVFVAIAAYLWIRALRKKLTSKYKEPASKPQKHNTFSPYLVFSLLVVCAGFFYGAIFRHGASQPEILLHPFTRPEGSVAVEGRTEDSVPPSRSPPATASVWSDAPLSRVAEDSVPPQSNAPSTASVRSNTPLSNGTRSPDECCEWVAPSTHQNGTLVEGYWRSNRECIGGCPLSEPPVEAKEQPPAKQLKAKAPSYVGPRGGHYHYSASGKKVYEHKK